MDPDHLLESTRTRFYERVLEYRAMTRSSLAHESRRVFQPGTSYRDADAIVDLMAISESFTSVRARSATVNEFEVGSTWPKREEFYQKTFSVEFSSFPQWDSFMGYVVARNALQHGLGDLTEIQLAKKQRDKHLAHLTAAGIKRNGRRLHLDADDVKGCAATGMEFVEWLDMTLRASGH